MSGRKRKPLQLPIADLRIDLVHFRREFPWLIAALALVLSLGGCCCEQEGGRLLGGGQSALSSPAVSSAGSRAGRQRGEIAASAGAREETSAALGELDEFILAPITFPGLGLGVSSACTVEDDPWGSCM